MRGSIVVEGLGKVFRRQIGDRPTTLKETIIRGWRRSSVEQFWGLREISFVAQPGRCIGVVGKNGAGKSTLLRLIGGVGKPDEGQVRMSGRVGALLDLGAGLSDDLTGRENVFVAGVIAGMMRYEVADKFQSIVEFAELEKFINSPIRTYSTGMRMRLAFAVAVHIEPDILLVDEVLAVGDSSFQRKCLARIAEIKASGCTIFLVSHASAQIRALCDEVIYLRKGRLVAHGPTDETLALYETSATPGSLQPASKEAQSIPLPTGKLLQVNVNRFGSLEAEISSVAFLNEQGARTRTILSGGALCIEIFIRSEAAIRGTLAAVSIHLPDGTVVFDSNSDVGGLNLRETHDSSIVRLSIDRLDLIEGTYAVSVGIYAADWEYAYDFHSEAYPLAVIGLGTGKGFLNPPLKWSFAPGAPKSEATSSSVHVTRAARWGEVE
jgi:lipopolysaccharide transport system ATP-binding protein